MSPNQVALWYLVASVLFILALKGLSHPSTARRGNLFGIIGMAIAVVVTLALVYSNTRNVAGILAGIAIGLAASTPAADAAGSVAASSPRAARPPRSTHAEQTGEPRRRPAPERPQVVRPPAPTSE